MSLLFLVYGSLAALAFRMTCRDEYLRWLGLWLVIGWGLSNILDFGHVPVAGRIGPYTGIEIMVAVAAAWALAERSYWLVAILCFNLLSLAANIGLAINFPADQRQIYLWKATTNLCFAGECLFAFGIGLANEFRSGRIDHWFFVRRHVASPSANTESDPR